MDPSRDTQFSHNFSPESGVIKNEQIVSSIRTRQGAKIAALYVADLRSMLNVNSVSIYGSAQQL